MAKDLIHESVKQALINDNWTITDDPFKIELLEDGRSLEADLGAEKIFSAEKGAEKIVVEIKTFSGSSIIHQFHKALGQYLAYKTAMKEAEVDRHLFLAVSVNTFYEFMEIKFINLLIQQFEIKVIVVNLEKQEIKKWII